MQFRYFALFEPGDEGGIVVSFPDVPEAITQGDGMADARVQAREALGLALLTYPRRGLPFPRPSAKGKDLVPVVVDPETAAKLAVIERFSRAGISKSELGRRLGVDEKAVRRLLDPKHPTKLSTLVAALEALGAHLVIGTEEAA